MKTRTLLVTLGAAGAMAIGALTVPALADPPSNGNGNAPGTGTGRAWEPVRPPACNTSAAIAQA
jgi:hypothetical protein